ncbi:MAG: phage tail protein [Comamonadaceae bacterium]|nr:phage tail protein [Comamonadaceae bacterium]
MTLEQGLSHDPVFENWANLVNNVEGDAAMSLKNFRKDIVINVLNLQGQVAISYKLFRAWVSEYQALPDFDAGTMNAVGIQTITLQHEGWQRDTGGGGAGRDLRPAAMASRRQLLRRHSGAGRPAPRLRLPAGGRRVLEIALADAGRGWEHPRCRLARPAGEPCRTVRRGADARRGGCTCAWPTGNS